MGLKPLAMTRMAVYRIFYGVCNDSFFVNLKEDLTVLFERVEKVDTLPYGNAVRSKIRDFRTALYPRGYHPSALEKPLNKRFFAYKVFFRRTCQRKNVNAA